MENRIKQLEDTVEELKKQLQKFNWKIEPKTWYFIWQEWYDPINEQSNRWNWYEFTPSYWKNVTTNNNIINNINNSVEIETISWKRISLNNETEVKTSFTLDKVHDGVNYWKVILEIANNLTTNWPDIFYKWAKLN